MKPQKHAELIKAWADGQAIESRRNGSASWGICTHPSWYELAEYRIKQEPKPDIVEMYKAKYSETIRSVRPAEHWEQDNLKLTFDRDTGKLKSAEVIK